MKKAFIYFILAIGLFKTEAVLQHDIITEYNSVYNLYFFSLIRQPINYFTNMIIFLKNLFTKLGGNWFKNIYSKTIKKHVIFPCKIYKDGSDLQVWFEISDKINHEFLNNVYYTLQNIPELKDTKFRSYLASVFFDDQFYNVGKRFIVTPDTDSVKYVTHILNALGILGDKAYPVNNFEYFIVNIKILENEDKV